MKFILLLIICSFCIILSNAQDTIIFKSGKQKIGTISKVEGGYIFFTQEGRSNERKISSERVEKYTKKGKQEVREEVPQEYHVNEELKLPYVGEKVTFTNKFKAKTDNPQDAYALLLRYSAEKEEGITKTLKSKNADQLKITLRCMVPSSYETFFKTEQSKVFFNMILSIADGYYQTVLTDFYIESPDANTTIEVWDSHSGEFFKSQLDNIYRQMNQLLKDVEDKIKSYN
ncbi:MAG TPA: hypothetical protein P5050_09070 [Bacteroidia bacterium]|nr:hypothetical protein [Bacteroidia bacterium]HRS59358.1 hypothetical protein [Bacteroidia bacterium]HRU69055.1 hypothetical protein [Bacteroidia bacterium]